MKRLKNFFFEEQVDTKEVYEANIDYHVPEVAVVLDGVHTDTLVRDIYDKNNLSDTSKSIFKVEEVMHSLPKEMATDTKKASVKGILSSFGLTQTELTLDAENRAFVLDSALSKINEEGNAAVKQKAAEIENHKMEMERLEKDIADENEKMKVSQDTITAEIKRVAGLLEFIGGV